MAALQYLPTYLNSAAAMGSWGSVMGTAGHNAQQAGEPTPRRWLSVASHPPQPMSTARTPSRLHGIEMEPLARTVDSVTFPVRKDALLESYGGRELEYPTDETVTLESVIEPVGTQTFASADELLETVLHMVGRGAVGRSGRTGRGTSARTPPGHQRPPGKPESDEEVPPSL